MDENKITDKKNEEEISGVIGENKVKKETDNKIDTDHKMEVDKKIETDFTKESEKKADKEDGKTTDKQSENASAEKTTGEKIESKLKDGEEKETGEKSKVQAERAASGLEKNSGEKDNGKAEENQKTEKKAEEKLKFETVKEKKSDEKDLAQTATEAEKKKNEEAKADVEQDVKERQAFKNKFDESKEDMSIPEPHVDMSAASKEKKKKKAGIAVLCTIFGLLLVAYIVGALFFSNYYYPDVKLNGLDVSLKNEDEARQLLNNSYVNYKLDIKTIDGTVETVNKADISMQIQMKDEFKKSLQEQQPWLWFVYIFSVHDYHISADVTWDEEALDKVLSKFAFMKKEAMIKPVNASVGIEGKNFVIIKEKYGTTIIPENFSQCLKEALMALDPMLDLTEKECYEKPTVLSDDEALKNEAEAMAEYNGVDITFMLHNLEEKKGLELYEELLEYKNNSAAISKNSVEKYVKELAKRCDTVGKERTFTTSYNGRKIKTTGPNYGFELDQEATVEALYKALNSKKSGKVEAVFTKTGSGLSEENDIGDTYVEVNLSEQEMHAYKDGELIAKASIVSGRVAEGNGTPSGLFSIYDKVSPTVLRGERKKVVKEVTVGKGKKKKKKKVESWEYDYESPVTYWMPYSGGIGLHDATWRSVFGGSIYYYGGSHGCVNLPFKTAETLYQNLDIGTPVIVYYWDE